ncbi:flavodoxin family protein [Halomonas saccharevitans]|uniref:Flavodoxin family protein n=1 Tax=Halomonas saccharevitans TaxID=416872 RepID=A0ABU3NHU9_9GAMM|nr:NAD(P)H-dependent oxidoreductase [Halomonas saccharevitans]MDT8880746.1 flavodoxin family protein [Halomonas saccharevitans]
MPRLLIVAHAPSPNTRRLREAAERGARHPDIEDVEVVVMPPLETGPEDVRACDAILLGTTENLGTMSGALKDFFDRSYYPVLEEQQGLPCALYVRAGHDGTGTRRAVESIVTGLRWKWVQAPLILRGEWQEGFADQVEELAMALAAGLDAGIL